MQQWQLKRIFFVQLVMSAAAAIPNMSRSGSGRTELLFHRENILH
jgi:hypothetical protein